MRSLALLAALSGCAAVTSTCPVGTKPVGGKPPVAQEQYCSSANAPTTVTPIPGPTFDDALGIGAPTQMSGGGVEGPYTRYYADGAIEAHGWYSDLGARSVPHGVWGFWYPNGRRRTMGEYKRGAPSGCFAVWDETGTQRTGFVEGTTLRVSPCTPPSDETLLVAEGHGTTGSADPVTADITLETFLGGGDFGARAANQIDPNPSMNIGFLVVARKYLGPIRIGPLLGYRTGALEYGALSFGAAVAYALPSLHPRLDLDIGVEIGGHRLTPLAIRRGIDGDAELTFYNAIAALQLTAALAVTPAIDLVLGARVDGGLPRDVDRDVTYCSFSGCDAPVSEPWHLGGATYGVTGGLRVKIR